MAEFLLGYVYELEYILWKNCMVARSKAACWFGLVSVRVLLSNADIIGMRVLPHL